ncbi:MAG: CotH kinase family protein [Christensenellaceae bacterium]|nr:CotH kinase family protein [Christensenellaceae bacterium]
MKELIKRIVCSILALALISVFMLPIAAEYQTSSEPNAIKQPIGIADTGEPGSYTIAPRFSDGVTLDYAEDDLTVLGAVEGEMFRFSETKELRFTARFDEGWSYCDKYSVFFEDEPNQTKIITNDDGSFTFIFSAVEGESMALSELEYIAINATAAELPKLYIDIDIPFEDVDKQNWIDAQFTLTLGSKRFASGEFEGTGSVKGRGNSSWTYPKKPYSIKLSEKKSLLDIPKTKKYAIVPSYHDSSLMRNFITYHAYQGLTGINYVPKCEFVDVYLNGEYNGIYILVERIDIESTKVDIEEADADNLTGGYLIEKDIHGRINYQTDQWFNCPYWANTTKDYFVLKAPEPDDSELLEQMLSYLENYMQQLHDSVMGISGEEYTKYVDVDSWIDFIILQEIAKNIDGNFKTSCWMYKDRDDDHLYMTAPWDFDFAYGLVDWNNASMEHNDYYDCPGSGSYEDFMIINSSAPWVDSLYDNNPEFRFALMCKYTQYRKTIINDLFALIDEQAAYLTAAEPANNELWGKNFDYGVWKLRNWLNGRLEWLDSVWLLEDDEIDLNMALNAYRGELVFDTDSESVPFVGKLFDGRAVGMNGEGTESGVRLNVELMRGQRLSFEYSCSDGSLLFEVNGQPIVMQETNSGAFKTYDFIAREAGSFEFRWSFIHDGNGTAMLDNVYLSRACEMGDVDMDGNVSVADALITVRCALELQSLDESETLLADFDCDGRVTVADALLIIRRAMQII